MEVYESIAWIAIGFIPTLLAMETASRVVRGYKVRKGKRIALEIKTKGPDKR